MFQHFFEFFKTSSQTTDQNKISVQKVTNRTVTSQRVTSQTVEESKNEDSEQLKPLDPATIPKFVNRLEKPPVFEPFLINDKHLYHIDICKFEEQVLPQGFPKTTVWGYGGVVRDSKTCGARYTRSSPGATIEAVRGIPVMVNWRNLLIGSHQFAVDPTLHWANPNMMPMDPPKPWPAFPPGFSDAQFPVPAVTHLHGAEVSSFSDGHPEAWFTSYEEKGPAFFSCMYEYPNKQEPTTLWYHDHTLGMTRLNVYAGLAGFYLLRDPDNDGREKFDLPEGDYEIPLVIQDRSFHSDGSLAFNEQGIDPSIHPYWFPGMLGNTIMVNGKVWPNLNVERRQYRFRILNGSNDRFYRMKLSNGMGFIQIGSDGGYLPEPVELDTLLIAPAERMDILMDFSEITPGTSIILTNDAPAPFPDGGPADPDTTGQIMRFTVSTGCAPPVKPRPLPCRMNDIARLRPDSQERILTANEVDAGGPPIGMVLNGQKWAADVSELPRVGSTEDWVIVNLANGSHPIHLHLIQFQVLNRQEIHRDEYRARWEEVNGKPPLDHPTVTVPVEPYLVGDPIPPEPGETGWKDTAKAYPNQVLRIRVRYAPQNVPVCEAEPGKNLFPFDPSEGPGYVWHCHILDHEDNEMMRPLKVLP